MPNNFSKAIIDPSLALVISSNIISIFMAVYQQWPMGQILWVYWGQSVVIGVINVIRMLSLKEFSTQNFRMNDQSVPETSAAKKQIATFFAFHFGFFHFVYAIFLWQELPLINLPTEELLFLLMLVFGFIGSHGYSYRYNLSHDFKHKKPNIGTLMFYPYLRIIPMHLVIIFGAMLQSTASIVLFMVLKTLADAGMHMIEHHMFRRPEKL